MIKRFRKIKKDILRDDDEFSMDLLVRQMARARVEPDTDEFTDLSKKPKLDVKKGAGAGGATSL